MREAQLIRLYPFVIDAFAFLWSDLKPKGFRFSLSAQVSFDVASSQREQAHTKRAALFYCGSFLKLTFLTLSTN